MNRIELAEYHKFEQGAAFYIFHVADMKAYRIKEGLSFALENLQKPHHILSDSLSGPLYHALQKLNLIKSSDEQSDNPNVQTPEKTPVTNISLNVAQLCNLSCIYCYGLAGEYGQKGYMKADTALEAVDWLIEQSLDAKDIAITFFGGEPLLNFPLIKEVVKYAKQKVCEHSKKVHFSITTNGTFFNNEINRFLNKNKFSVTVSFDGDPEMQNINRPFKGGQGSYDAIKDKVEDFLETRNGKAVGRATITGHNTDLKRVRNSLIEIGFKSIGMTKVSNRDLAKMHLDCKKYEKMLQNLEELALETLDNIKQRNPIYDKKFLDIIRRLYSKIKKKYFCGVGRGLLAISNTGDIYPCHRFVGLKTMKMGDIQSFESSSQKPYIENYGMAHPKCRECWARYFCGGGCIHENIAANGEMWKPDDNWCQELRRSVELGIMIYDKLNESDKEHLGFIKHPETEETTKAKQF